MRRESNKTAMAWASLLLAGGIVQGSEAAPIEGSSSPGAPQRVGHVAVRAFDATRHGIERGAEVTVHGVKRGAQATGRGIETGAKAVVRVAHRVVEKF